MAGPPPKKPFEQPKQPFTAQQRQDLEALWSRLIPAALLIDAKLSPGQIIQVAPEDRPNAGWKTATAPIIVSREEMEQIHTHNWVITAEELDNGVIKLMKMCAFTYPSCRREGWVRFVPPPKADPPVHGGRAIEEDEA